MWVAKKWISKIDAADRHQKIKKQYPEYADKAHNLIISCLEENDPERLKVFLGLNNEDGTPGISVDRIFMYFSQSDLCRHLQRIDQKNLWTEWSEQSLDWYVRRLLKLPFKTIDGGAVKDE